MAVAINASKVAFLEKVTYYAVIEPISDESELMNGLNSSQLRELKGMEWFLVEDEPHPTVSLLSWMKDIQTNVFQDNRVILFEALQYLVEQSLVDLDSGIAAVVVFDVYDQVNKLILFK